MAFSNNSVLRKGYVCRKEGQTDEAITPGHLIEYGGTNDIQKHSTDGGFAIKAFALENDLVGDDLDDAYATGEAVQFGVCAPGTEINAILADNQTVAVGEFLVSAGDGTLREATSDAAGVYVAVALEAVTTSGATSRILVEVV